MMGFRFRTRCGFKEYPGEQLPKRAVSRKHESKHQRAEVKWNSRKKMYQSFPRWNGTILMGAHFVAVHLRDADFMSMHQHVNACTSMHINASLYQLSFQETSSASEMFLNTDLGGLKLICGLFPKLYINEKNANVVRGAKFLLSKCQHNGCPRVSTTSPATLTWLFIIAFNLRPRPLQFTPTVQSLSTVLFNMLQGNYRPG